MTAAIKTQSRKSSSSPLAKTGYAQCGKIRIHYQDEFLVDRDTGLDKIIVLIAGLGTQLTIWPQPFIDRLVAEGYRVIRFDNRDIGHSSEVTSQVNINLPKSVLRSRLKLPMSSDYTLFDMAQDVLGLIDHLELNKVHIVGVSMGGMIGQIFAALYPHRCSSLTSMMSSTNNPLLPPPRLDVLLAAMGVGVAKGHTKEVAVARSLSFWNKIASPDYPTPNTEIKRRIAADFDRSYRPSGYLRQANAIVATGDFSHLLRRVNCPTLVIHGDKDPFVKLRAGIASSKAIPNAELKVVNGMGHDLPLQLIPRLCDMVIYNTRKEKINAVSV